MSRTVRHRRVFYIPGFDPIHPRRYRELYRSEGAAQAAISGYDLELRAKRAGGPYGWHVSTAMEGQQVETDIEVLLWADIVRDGMGHGIAATYGQLVRTAWTYIASGALFRLMRLRQGPVIAALYPVVFLLAQLALALGLGALLGWAGAQIHPALVVLGLAPVVPVLMWFRKHDNRFFAYYLMHDYAYSAQARGANPPELEARMTEFGARIRAALEEGADEVLIVGHSSGAHLAVSVLADLHRAGLPKGELNLLTLGQVVPMVSFLPEAQRLRADLALLAAQDRVAWVDVTAPGDGCAFALCDPVAVSGVAPADQRWPLVISAAFTQSLSPERWQELKRRYFRLHFQYLCAFDAVKDYDYFRITAGPQTLRARFTDRAPSPSRKTQAVNRYTSQAAL